MLSEAERSKVLAEGIYAVTDRWLAAHAEVETLTRQRDAWEQKWVDKKLKIEELITLRAENKKLKSELDKAWRAALEAGDESTRLRTLIFKQADILREGAKSCEEQQNV